MGEASVGVAIPPWRLLLLNGSRQGSGGWVPWNVQTIGLALVAVHVLDVENNQHSLWELAVLARRLGIQT